MARWTLPPWIPDRRTVTIYLGNGSGGFTASAGGPFQTGTSPVAIVAVDLNRDGKVDLAIANQGGLNAVTVLLGNGAGGFAAAPGSPFAVGFNPTSMAVCGSQRRWDAAGGGGRPSQHPIREIETRSVRKLFRRYFSAAQRIALGYCRRGF